MMVVGTYFLKMFFQGLQLLNLRFELLSQRSDVALQLGNLRLPVDLHYVPLIFT